jgi:hypothetical protein
MHLQLPFYHMPIKVESWHSTRHDPPTVPFGGGRFYSRVYR